MSLLHAINLSLLCWLLQLISVGASPTLLVDSARSKCVAIEVPMDTHIHINYTAPDVVLDTNHEDYAPSYITVNLKPARRVLDKELHESPVATRLKPTSHLIEAREGEVIHKVETDGEASICVRSAKATNAHPYRFSLNIDTMGADEVAKLPVALNDHLTHMETEMRRVESAMKHILREADFSKERDALFHKQTQDMHSATIFWPIIHVCVLLMTGFTQASHIVNFFKRHRII